MLHCSQYLCFAIAPRRFLFSELFPLLPPILWPLFSPSLRCSTMTQLGYLDNSKPWAETMLKDGIVGPMGCADLLTESFSLQSLKLSNQAEPDKEGKFTGGYPEERRQKYEGRLLSREEKLGKEVELRSPVEDGNTSLSVVKTQNGSTAASSSIPNKSMDHVVVSEPIDIVQSPSGTSKIYSRCQRREFFLEDAWERKRVEKSGDWKNKKTQKADVSVRSKSDRADGRRICTSLEVNKCRSRTRSLTDDDFEELRGCIDLGFSFGEEYSPDLCDTLPALKACYAISQTYHDSQGGGLSPVSTVQSVAESPKSSISSWQICSPGDHPQQVKAKLRHWAQAVACTVRQSC